MGTRLSVVIPGFNTPDSLWQRCLSSVVAACGANDEIICIDDGSRNRPTVGISDVRIKWILLEQNLGQSAARNAGLRVAQGEWVAFVDSDDEVLPCVYEKAISNAAASRSDMCVFGVQTVYSAEKLCIEKTCPELPPGELGTNGMASLVDARLFDLAWNKVFRRSFLVHNEINFPVGICPGEDSMFVLSCVLKGARWSTMPDVGYVYYRADGTSLSRYFTNYIETLRYWKQQWDAYFAGPGQGYEGWWPTMGFSEEWVARCQWNNIWKRGTPYSLHARWTYLRKYPRIGGTVPLWTFVKKMVFAFMRLHFYIRPIRRWHIKRRRKDAVEMSSSSKD